MQLANDDQKKFTLPKSTKTPVAVGNRNYAIAYMFIEGKKPDHIAKEVGIEPESVRRLLMTDEMKTLIDKVRHNLFGKDVKKRIEHILPKAMDVNEKIMLDETVKPSVRKDIAMDFMDRHLGKPTQPLTVQSSSIRELIITLKEKKPIDLASGQDKNQALDADYLEIPVEDIAELADDKSEIEKWVATNFSKK